MAIDNALIQTIKNVPFLFCVAKNPSTLPGESPVKSVNHARIQDRGVADDRTLAVVGQCLFRRRSWQERRLRIVEVLQCTPPEDILSAICREMVVDTGDEGIVI